MKKRILFIMPAMPGGGAEKVLIDILKNFDFQKYDVTLFLEFREGVYLPEIPAEVEVISLHGRNTRPMQIVSRLLSERSMHGRFHSALMRPLIRRKLKGRQFDCIVSFMEGAALKLHSYLIDKAPRHVSWVHIDLQKKHWSLPFFDTIAEEQRCYGLMHRVVCVSEDVRRAYCELIGANTEHAIVLRNLINATEIRNLAAASSQPKDETFTICMAGRLNQQKRYDRALQAMAILSQKGRKARLRILGDGELREQLQNMAKELGIENKVDFMGFRKPPYPWICNCDVFLNSSESEGYPLTICEALCLWLPVVATKISGAAEILDDGYGILTDETPESISDALIQLIDDEKLRKSYAEKAMERALMFDVSHTMAEIYKIID